MKQRTTLEIELRGQPVTVEFFIQESDPSVGLMGFGFEDETITDAEGNLLPWELTDDETALITDKVNQMVLDGHDES